MKSEQRLFSCPYLCGLHYVILRAAVVAKRTGLHGRQVKLQITSHASTFVSRHSRHVHALFLDGLRTRPRGQEGKMERTICSTRWFILLFFIAAWHVRCHCLIFIGPIIYRVEYRWCSCVVSYDVHTIEDSSSLSISLLNEEKRDTWPSLWLNSKQLLPPCLRRHLRDLKYSWYIRGACMLRDLPLDALYPYPDTRAVIMGYLSFRLVIWERY